MARWNPDMNLESVIEAPVAARTGERNGAARRRTTLEDGSPVTDAVNQWLMNPEATPLPPAPQMALTDLLRPMVLQDPHNVGRRQVRPAPADGGLLYRNLVATVEEVLGHLGPIDDLHQAPEERDPDAQS